MDREECPYSRPVRGQKVLRGCLLREVEGTGPRGPWSYLIQCPPKGYANNFRDCPDCVKAKENDVDPDELAQTRRGKRRAKKK